MLSLCGCQRLLVRQSAGKPLLQPARMSPDAVALAVFSVQLRQDDLETFQAIWDEVDEVDVAAETRRRLRENGFRVGLVGNHLPRAVQQLLELGEHPHEERDPNGQQVNEVKFNGRPTLRIHHMQLRARQRGEIAASGVRGQAPLLFHEDGQLRGRTFEECQGMLAIKSFPGGDGRTRLQVTPEVHFGAPRQRFSGENGVLRLQTSRPRKSFDALTQSLVLSPGQSYMISACPERPGSIGHFFFADDSGDLPQRKVLFVRLSQTQADDLFQLDEDKP